MSIIETANEFFAACETGKGWEGCKQYCQPRAGFSCQADALADITTLEAYCDWMKGLLVSLPDAAYDIKAMSLDSERGVVTAYAVIQATHTVDGPIPATHKSVTSDYVYAMHFADDKVSHMTKIWNDGFSLKQLGWA